MSERNTHRKAIMQRVEHKRKFILQAMSTTPSRNRQRDVPTERERLTAITNKHISVRGWVILGGEAIRRKVAEITDDHYLKLDGFPVPTCPTTVRLAGLE